MTEQFTETCDQCDQGFTDWCPYCDTCGDDGVFGAACPDCENGTKYNHDHDRWSTIVAARWQERLIEIAQTGIIPW